MTQKEKLKEAVVRAAVEGKLTAEEAGKRLGVSGRQVRKLKAKLREGQCLKHGNSRSSPKRMKDEPRTRIVNIYKDARFEGSNFSHFKELLEIHFGIKVGYTVLAEILNEAGIKSPKKQRKRKIHKSREPREYFGELLQTDGSHHRWFEHAGDNNFYTLHGFIDDATGTVTGCYFSKNECLDGYFEAFRQTLEKYGVPEAIYADGSSIFFGKQTNLSVFEIIDGVDENKTQFGQIAEDLGINLIHAHSPQAKGKIERLWQTLQSRLITEFKVHGITDMASANQFLPPFINKINKQFSRPAKFEKSLFLPLPRGINLDILLTKTTTRQLDAGLVFSLSNYKFRVDGGSPKATVKVLMSSRIGMKVLYQDKLLVVTPLFPQERLLDIMHHYLLKNEHLAYGKIDIRRNFSLAKRTRY